ncbi:MAG: DEAD/DEAH box helicase [Desulfobulbaceae bacterium]|nr:DEAD/DEAH box helicase [Desulfobulbaceae bacterium]
MDNRKDCRAILKVSSECCFQGISQEFTNHLKTVLTIDNPKYLAAQRYGRWIGKKLLPKLYFYREEEDLFYFPRGFGNQAVSLYRQECGEDPEIVDNRQLLPEISLSFQGELRPYQEDAVSVVSSRSFGVLEAATGSGKTIMALSVIAKRKQPTLIVVHSKELLYQWVERIEQFLGVTAGKIGDGKFDIRPVSVAIVNTARKRLADLKGCFGQIIVDECHRVPATLFTDVVSAFESYYMLGLSATAFCREDGMTKLIYLYMGDRLHSVDIKSLTHSGAVVRPTFIIKETSFVYEFAGDYSKMIKALVENEQRNNRISQDIADVVAKGHAGTILVVSDRVAHCQLLAEKLAAHNVETAVLTGKTSSRRRMEIVEEVRNGTIAVLISTLQLIGEGFDCPGLSTLVLATPIKFEGRLLQVVGRIMRPADGKKAQVIDYQDVLVPLFRKSGMARMNVFDSW